MESQSAQARVGSRPILLDLVFAAFVISILADCSNFLLDRLADGTGVVVIAIKGVVLLITAYLIRSRTAWLFLAILMLISSFRLLNNLRGGGVVVLEDIVFLFRILLLYMFCFVFFQIRGTLRFEGIARFVRVVLVIECLTIFAAWFFKLDLFRAYQWRDGYKGWFVHINDEAFILAAGLLYTLTRWSKPWNKALFFLIVLGLFIMGLGSRTALLSIVAVPCFYLFSNAIFAKGRERIKYFIIAGILLITIGATAFAFWDILMSSFFQQAAEMYVKSGNLIHAIMTGRDEHIIAQFEEHRDWTNLLFGSYIPYDRLPSQMIESDIFDYLFRFGIVGTTLCGILFWRLVKAANPGDIITARSLAFLIMIFFIGSLTGHVLVSSENSPWIAFFLVEFSKTNSVTS